MYTLDLYLIYYFNRKLKKNKNGIILKSNRQLKININIFPYFDENGKIWYELKK